MSLATPNEVFLSHAHSDTDFATSLVGTLRHHGIPVWFSQSNILGAQQWHDEIGNALQRCDWFAVVLSTAAVESKWVKRELVYALRENQYDNRIIPLLYKACDYRKLSWMLPDFQMIDFRENIDQGYGDLLRIWGLGYKRNP
jgi:hypothetical protein